MFDLNLFLSSFSFSPSFFSISSSLNLSFFFHISPSFIHIYSYNPNITNHHPDFFINISNFSNLHKLINLGLLIHSGLIHILPDKLQLSISPHFISHFLLLHHLAIFIAKINSIPTISIFNNLYHNNIISSPLLIKSNESFVSFFNSFNFSPSPFFQHFLTIFNKYYLNKSSIPSNSLLSQKNKSDKFNLLFNHLVSNFFTKYSNLSSIDFSDSYNCTDDIIHISDISNLTFNINNDFIINIKQII